MSQLTVEEKMGLTKVRLYLKDDDKSAFSADIGPDLPFNLLTAGINVHGEGFSLVYEAEGLISVAKYLRISTLNPDGVLRLFSSLAVDYLEADKVGINHDFLVYASDFVFINPNTAEIYYIYLPLDKGKKQENTLCSLLLELIFIYRQMNKNSHEGLEEIELLCQENDINSLLAALNAGASSAESPTIDVADGDHRIREEKGTIRLGIQCSGVLRQEEVGIFPCIIGRSPRSADIVIDDMSVSRKHAVIDYVDGSPHIADNFSSNGTYVNGDMIISEQWLPLLHGDVIRIGSATIIVL